MEDLCERPEPSCRCQSTNQQSQCHNKHVDRCATSDEHSPTQASGSIDEGSRTTFLAQEEMTQSIECSPNHSRRKRGRNTNKPKKKTREQLDAELDEYFCNGTAAASTQPADIEVTARLIEFKSQARALTDEISSIETNLRMLGPCDIPASEVDSTLNEIPSSGQQQKRALTLRLLVDRFNRKALTLETGNEYDIINLLADESRMGALVEEWYRTDESLRVPVDAAFHDLDHWAKMFRLKGLFCIVQEELEKLEEERAGQLRAGTVEELQVGLAGMGVVTEQEKMSAIADLIQGLSL